MKRSQESDFHFRMLLEEPNYKIVDSYLFRVRRGHDSIEQQSNSLEAQLSVLYYFEKAFNLLVKKTNETSETKKLEKYLLFRVFNQKYIVLSKIGTFKERLKFVRKLNGFKYFNCLSIKDFTSVNLGLCLMLFFKKGYSFLVLKKYDYRDY
ncbi:hypothetical protein [Tenacibaculum aquimarinum]|uniref:hypothetical protein n=1 Tax=Tenacibaculum aquimarinum TaxID=2910675 RepID=UPI001F0A991C|nr:hypothetical protein [Tenacibaculum aquimarinum]MCH3884983.1 hypothetical protein [Tenacibaculum aquimarinum]